MAEKMAPKARPGAPLKRGPRFRRNVMKIFLDSETIVAIMYLTNQPDLS
jgi:hypothetical protein